jgi:iron only hydrogenase large subunit-like protein
MKALKTNKLTQNFFEGMVCKGGCLNGPLSLKHNSQVLVNIDKFGEKSPTNDPNISVDKFIKSVK